MPRFALIVLLHLDSDHGGDYERFETAASGVMERHGGRIERRFSTSGTTDRDHEVPDEVHLVTFPSPEAFEAYRRDPALAQLAELRARAIRKTVVWPSNELPRFP